MMRRSINTAVESRVVPATTLCYMPVTTCRQRSLLSLRYAFNNSDIIKEKVYAPHNRKQVITAAARALYVSSQENNIGITPSYQSKRIGETFSVIARAHQ